MRAWESYEGGYRGFSRDVRLAYEQLSRVYAADQPYFAQRLRCQLVLSSIHSIGANIPWELLVAAFKARILTYWQVAHWLEFKPSDDRVRALGGLAPYLPPELGAEVLSEALTAAQNIEDSSDRARALGGLAPHLPPELLSEALAAARNIEDNFDRARALGGLALHLPPELGAEVLSEALAAARNIKDSSDRAHALGELASQLSGNLRQQGFEELLAVLPRCERHLSLTAITSFFPFLGECQGPKGLEEVRRAIIDTARWFP